jgi:predicted dehydrogenase
MENANQQPASTTRRDFLTTTAAVGAAAVATNLGVLSNVHAGGNDLIKVGLVGCGGRGTGAAQQCVHGGPNVKLWAMGDAFRDRLEDSHRNLSGQRGMRERMDVPPARRFAGIDAYQQVLNNCDLVILATPPGFRPFHIEAAVRARKHIFTEKPVAVDGAGVRRVLAAYEEANRRNLCVVAGTQRRYQTGYLESMRRIHGGDLGELTSATCYWNQGGLWHRDRTPQMSDLEWQIRNWLYFTWLSGDHICEQHIHNLDVINWATRSHPVKATGVGGRQVRTGPQFGMIFDHFCIDYIYPSGMHLLSMCRQIDGCSNDVSEAVVGTRGKWHSPNPAQPNRYEITGERPWNLSQRRDNDPYQEEHIELIRRIRNNQQINTLRDVAESTLTAILGRMAAYSGADVTWEQALASETTMPQNLNWNMNLPVAPVAMPGRRA